MEGVSYNNVNKDDRERSLQARGSEGKMNRISNRIRADSRSTLSAGQCLRLMEAVEKWSACGRGSSKDHGSSLAAASWAP